jgi:TPR repeat protein
MRALHYLLFTVIVTASTLYAADFAAGVAAYEKGDYATALKEWEPLAEQGSAAAQFNLGLLSYDGLGVPQNYADAARWFRRAAEQGYTKAQRNLGAMYGVGKGVKRNYQQAYMWLSVCAAAGLESCEFQRDLVAQKLSRSKLASAQEMARYWKPRPEKPEAGTDPN